MISQARLRLIFLTSCALILAVSCNRPKEKSPEDLAKEFLNLYKAQGSRAVYFFFEGNKFAPPTEDLDTVKVQIENYVSQCGSYRGNTLLSKNKAGKDFVVLSYMMKYDIMPIRFNLVYYRPNTKWLPYNFYFDTEIQSELQSSTKIQYLPKTFEQL